MQYATIVIPRQYDHIYLAPKLQSVGKGYLTFYGGKFEGNEQGEECAAREFFDESEGRADPAYMQKVAGITFYFGTAPTFECEVFIIEKWEGELKATAEMGPPVAYPTDNLPFEKMWKGDRLWVPRVLSGEKFYGALVYDEAGIEPLSFQHIPAEFRPYHSQASPQG